MQYQIHKGVGRSVEFKGLKSQYLFIFAGGLLAIILIVIVLYMAGANNVFCILFGSVTPSGLIWLTFKLNRKYGEHGLMKLFANKHRPSLLINRKLINHIIKRDHHEKYEASNDTRE